jgi:hypothetical protein
MPQDKEVKRMSQIQLIRALGDAMAWFERELDWEVP